MKSLKKLYVTLALLSYAPTAILGSSYEQRIKDFYPVDNSDRADIPNIVKQEIYKLNGLQEGFRLIGENFEKFVDTNIAKLMPAEDDADVDAIELLDALNQKIENEIIRKITPVVVNEIKTAIDKKEDLEIDQPEEFAKKHPALKYASDYSDSFTRQIFKDMKELSGEITKSVMNQDRKSYSKHEFLDLYYVMESEPFLMQAVANKNISVITFLLKAGVDVNATNDSRDTALHISAKKNSDKFAQFLIDHGADVNAKNISESTPLHTASSNNSYAVTQILIDHGANVNAINDNGFTPLHLSAEKNSDKIAQILIDHGADVNAGSFYGNTPLQKAVRHKSDKVIQILLANCEQGKKDQTVFRPFMHN